MTTDELADTEVICPGCAHHFPAIPMATQTRLRELQADYALADARADAYYAVAGREEDRRKKAEAENTRLREALAAHGIEVPNAAN